MMAKLLKRKVSRVTIEAPDPALLAAGGDAAAAITARANVTSPATTLTSTPAAASQQPSLPQQYKYRRPDLLGDYGEEDYAKFASHFERPVVSPRDAKGRLPDGIGYAEAMNAGKSKLNEDQASVHEGTLVGVNGVSIPYVYIGLFDGHGGAGCAIKASKELHNILHEGLEDVLPYMAVPEKRAGGGSKKIGRISEESEDSDKEDWEEDENVDVKMDLDELVCGALESSFWAMDRLILADKAKFKITGGATAMVALFICGKLYVANAGDCRAGLRLKGRDEDLLVMSRDHTPSADRQRIQHIAFQRPELLRHPTTKQKLYNRHILSRKVGKEDLGISIMYQDFYMSGWSCRDVSAEDITLVPVITGRGKQCRLLATVGVARGLGDHDLLAKGSGVSCKEFLTSHPEVQVYELDEVKPEDYLVMGTDGMWDVLSNEAVAKRIGDKLTEANVDSMEEVLARDLVAAARGKRDPAMYWEMDNGALASGDDITGIVVSLAKAKRELGTNNNN